MDRKEHERRAYPVTLSFRTDIPRSQYREKSPPDRWDSSRTCARAAPFAPPLWSACGCASLALAALLHTSHSGLATLRLGFLPRLPRLPSLCLPPTRLATVRSVYPLPLRFPATWRLDVPLSNSTSCASSWQRCSYSAFICPFSPWLILPFARFYHAPSLFAKISRAPANIMPIIPTLPPRPPNTMCFNERRKRLTCCDITFAKLSSA